MSNSSQCGCNDYSLATANTGIVPITIGTPDLHGGGSQTAFTAAGANGSIVKSVIIKAIQPVTTGMIRLFVVNGSGTTTLYKEIPVPTTPTLAATPTPLPMLTTFEMKLTGDLKLANGNSLAVSAQNSDSFNIIVEGLDRQYPTTDPLPSACCNYMKETEENGLGIISVANQSLNGSGTIVAIYQALPIGDSNGSFIKSITIKALQATNEGIVRLFISPPSTNFSLMQEIYIPQTTQSGFDPSFKQVIDMNYNLKPGYIIGASTQLAQSFALTVEAVSWSYGIS